MNRDKWLIHIVGFQWIFATDDEEFIFIQCIHIQHRIRHDNNNSCNEYLKFFNNTKYIFKFYIQNLLKLKSWILVVHILVIHFGYFIQDSNSIILHQFFFTRRYNHKSSIIFSSLNVTIVVNQSLIAFATLFVCFSMCGVCVCMLYVFPVTITYTPKYTVILLLQTRRE